MISDTILILGDSTSMSIGLEEKTYPFLLANSSIWPENTKIVNCSMPGFTSADATAFFFRHYSSKVKSLRAVILYLGNCDTASTEVRKGKYGVARQLANKFSEFFGRVVAKTRLKNRLLHFEWNNSFNKFIELPESPDDFEYNINRVLNTCFKVNVPVVLVHPKANINFLPGIGKGNFLFYRYIGLKDKISSRIIFPDQKFKLALAQHELANYQQASEMYKEILSTPISKNINQEYPLLVLNNYAVAQYEAGEIEEAEYLFNMLLKENFARKEIVYYNLAQINKQQFKLDKYKNYLNDSYESDKSLYRIRSPYLKVLKRLTAKYSAIHSVEMSTLIADEHYLDHCHPLPKGQLKMAEKISEIFSVIGIKGTNKASIDNILYNPELAKGNFSNFHDYFKTYASHSETQIATALQDLKDLIEKDGGYDSATLKFYSIPREICAAIDYYLRHPYFTTVSDVFHTPPKYPSDVGRFPEYFIVRHLSPYLKYHEMNREMDSRFDNELNLLRGSSLLKSILPSKSIFLVDEEIPSINIEYETVRVPEIILKARRLLIEHLRAGNSIHNRVKTTIFWYVREALRYGAHSRVSMLYDRTLLEFIAEGLAVAGVIDIKINLNKHIDIKELINILEGTAKIHEEYCAKFKLQNDDEQLLIDYDQKLNILANKLEGNEVV